MNKTYHSDIAFFKIINNLPFIFDSIENNGIENLILNFNSGNYFACNFEFLSQKIEFRVSKVTPKKSGQFVVIWKRCINGKSIPYSSIDLIDFFVVLSKCETHYGYFVFPKSILVEKGILTKGCKEGKRGIRVYPSWDVPNNKQAVKTQNWQSKYFFCFFK